MNRTPASDPASDSSAPAKTETVSGGGGDARVYFAAERTLLAWIRTALALMGFGFVVARFGFFMRLMAHQEGAKSPSNVSLWVGMLLVVTGIVVSILSGIGHARFTDRWHRGEGLVVRRLPLAVLLAMGLGLIGAVMAIYLFHSRG